MKKSHFFGDWWFLCDILCHFWWIFGWDWGTPAILRQHPNIYGHFQGKLCFGQNPNFYQKFVLHASLITITDRLHLWCLTVIDRPAYWSNTICQTTRTISQISYLTKYVLIYIKQVRQKTQQPSEGKQGRDKGKNAWKRKSDFCLNSSAFQPKVKSIARMVAGWA